MRYTSISPKNLEMITKALYIYIFSNPWNIQYGLYALNITHIINPKVNWIGKACPDILSAPIISINANISRIVFITAT